MWFQVGIVPLLVRYCWLTIATIVGKTQFAFSGVPRNRFWVFSRIFELAQNCSWQFAITLHTKILFGWPFFSWVDVSWSIHWHCNSGQKRISSSKYHVNSWTVTVGNILVLWACAHIDIVHSYCRCRSKLIHTNTLSVSRSCMYIYAYMYIGQHSLGLNVQETVWPIYIFHFFIVTQYLNFLPCCQWLLMSMVLAL